MIKLFKKLLSKKNNKPAQKIPAHPMMPIIKSKVIKTVTPEDEEWDKIGPKMKLTVEHCLKNAAEYYKCKVEDLVPAVMYYSKGMPIIKVNKRFLNAPPA